jgi:biotin-(acetyl-CoA carboxylase) ligase
MVGEAKLAGVLVETRGFDPTKPHYVVGLGLNVRQRTFPAELLAERQAASLATLGLDVTIEVARRAVLEALRCRLGRVRLGHAELADDFLRATQLAGATVRVQVGEVEHEGQLESVSVAQGVRVRGRDENVRHFPLEIVRALSTSL